MDKGAISMTTKDAGMPAEIIAKKAACLERIEGRDDKDESWNDGYDHGVLNMCDWLLEKNGLKVAANQPPPSAEIKAALEWLKADKKAYEYGVANGDRGARDYDKIIARYDALIQAASTTPPTNTAPVTEGDALKFLDRLEVDVETFIGRDRQEWFDTIRKALQQASGARGWNFDMAAAPKRGIIIVTNGGGSWPAVWMGGYNGDGFYELGDPHVKINNIIAWQPLPAPPVKKGEEDV
jgi:hypothetical protein